MGITLWNLMYMISRALVLLSRCTMWMRLLLVLPRIRAVNYRTTIPSSDRPTRSSFFDARQRIRQPRSFPSFRRPVYESLRLHLLCLSHRWSSTPSSPDHTPVWIISLLSLSEIRHPDY